MKTHELKLELIDWILKTKNLSILNTLASLRAKDQSTLTGELSRKAGWGRELIAEIAEDFDEIPDGFKDYMP